VDVENEACDHWCGYCSSFYRRNHEHCSECENMTDECSCDS
jgi:hypothetical protein